MPQNAFDDKSTLDLVMAWCRQATSHYLRQCWTRSMSPYSVTTLSYIWTEDAKIWICCSLEVSANLYFISQYRLLSCCKGGGPSYNLLWCLNVTAHLFPHHEVEHLMSNAVINMAVTRHHFATLFGYCTFIPTINAKNKTNNKWDIENTIAYVDGSVQDCSISIANALEILQSCTKPSMYLCRICVNIRSVIGSSPVAPFTNMV